MVFLLTAFGLYHAFLWQTGVMRRGGKSTAGTLRAHQATRKADTCHDKGDIRHRKCVVAQWGIIVYL